MDMDIVIIIMLFSSFLFFEDAQIVPNIVSFVKCTFLKSVLRKITHFFADASGSSSHTFKLHREHGTED